MKKIFLLLILIIALTLPVACMPNDEDIFRVTFTGEDFDDFYVTVKEGDSVSEPAAPIKTDGRLIWVDGEGQEYDFSLPVKGNMVLRAVIVPSMETPPLYTVSFYGVDGQLIGEPQLVEEGKSATAPAVTVSDFFAFDGWDVPFNNVTQDIEVHARQRYNPVSADIFTYRYNSDLTYCITGIKYGKKLPQMSGGYIKLALPTQYQGTPITSINDGSRNGSVFSNKNIIAVYVPSSYKRIGNYAFYGNPALMQVVFNEGLIEIGEGAFMATFGDKIYGSFAHSGESAYVSALTSVSFPKSLEVIGDHAFDHIGAAYDYNSVRPVTVEFKENGNLREIGDHAFEGAMIYDLVLPSTTTPLEIGDYAFAADTYLNWVFVDSFESPRSVTEKLTLPSTIGSIGDYAFYGMGVMSTQMYLGIAFETVNNVEFNCPKLALTKLGNNAFAKSKLTGGLRLTVSEVGERAFYGQTFSTIDVETEKIGDYAFGRDDGTQTCELRLGDKLTAIGNGAFINNDGMYILKLPDSLEELGDYSFAGCETLTGIFTLPEKLVLVGDHAFENCSITSVNILGVTSFGAYAFASSDIAEVTGKIVSVSEGTFAECAKLVSLTLPDNMSEIYERLFYGCSSIVSIKIPDSVGNIGRSAFENCVNLVRISLPENMTSIGNGAFEKCSSLVEVKIADGLEIIDSYAFSYCTSLKSVALPDSVRTIGNYAFQGSALTSFKTPASLKNLGWRVFYACEVSIDKIKTNMPRLNSFTISRDTGELQFNEQGTFDGANIESFKVEAGNTVYSSVEGHLCSYDGKTLIRCLRTDSAYNVRVPEGITTISSYAFMGNSFMTSLVLPSTLMRIEDYAFYNCTRLRELTLPQNVISVGKYAFAGDSSNMSELAVVTLNDKLETIGRWAFAYNCRLASISIPSSLTTIEDYAFYAVSDLSTLDLSRAAKLDSIGVSAFSAANETLAPKLRSVNFNACTSLLSTGEQSFANCSRLTQIDFGALTEIGEGSFTGCTSLVTLEIGENVRKIGAGAFVGCTSLSNIVLPEENELAEIGAYAFAGTINQKVNYSKVDLTNATELKTIDHFAFAYGNIKEVVLPDSAFTLGNNVFDSCVLLTSVDFGSVTHIGENVFRSCTSLKTLNIPSSVTTIAKNAFRSLNIERVTIGNNTSGNSLTSIGREAFFDCKNLGSVKIYGSNIPRLEDGIFNLAFYYYNGGLQQVISGLTIEVDGNVFDAYSSSSEWSPYKNLFSARR